MSPIGPLETLIVSPEMTVLIGTGAATYLPDDATMLHFSFGGVGMPATLRIARDVPVDGLALALTPVALDRLFGWTGPAAPDESFHLTPELRAIAVALRDCAMQGEPRLHYRIAKAIELLCETVPLIVAGALVPIAAEGALSLADSRRLMDAKRMIDERWSEKLTLDALARACGINRAKLTRGFRDLYRCSIAEALAEKRLGEASRRLLTTDLPVSTIGYDSGYLNNASFTRAFGRRFGVSPSAYRGRRLAA